MHRVADLRRAVAVASILASALLIGSSAAASPAPVAHAAAQRFFHSPGDKIECELDYHERGIPALAYCESIPAAVTATMSASGKIKICGARCLSNGPENARALPVGETVALGPFSCRSLRHAIRCRVSSGQGFTVTYSGIEIP